MLSDKFLADLHGFSLLKQIGRGGDARVLLVKEKEGGQKRAMKVPLKQKCTKNLKKEVEMLEALAHPNIVKCIKRGPSSSFMVLEYNEEGDLLDRVMSCKRFPEPIARFYFLHLVDTLAFLHMQGIVHRDIKLENLMLDKSFKLKLIDFGFASRLAETSLALDDPERASEDGFIRTEVLGTAGYQPPEMLFSRSGYDPTHHDFFAAGVALFGMVVGVFPFDEATESSSLYQSYITGSFQNYWQIFEKNLESVSDLFKEFIQGLLAFNPRSRLNSLEKIRSHPWCFGKTATPDEIAAFFKPKSS